MVVIFITVFSCESLYQKLSDFLLNVFMKPLSIDTSFPIRLVFDQSVFAKKNYNLGIDLKC